MHNYLRKQVKLLTTLSLTVAAVLILWLAFSAAADTPTARAQTADTPTPVPTVEQGDNTEEALRALAETQASPPMYPNMDFNLNRIVQQVQTGQFTAQAAAADAPIHQEESVAVTLYLTEGYAQDVWDWLEESGASPRSIGIDYIEAYVPVSLLPEASQQEGVISVRTIIPPQPAQGTVVSDGVALHGATAWHAAGLKGQGVKIGIIDGGFEGFASLMGTELPASVEARCYTDIGIFTSSLADCENEDVHGTAVTEAVFDIAPEAIYYITNPGTPGNLVTAVEWLIEHDVDVINLSGGWLWEGPGDGTTPFSNGALRSVDTAVAGGITWVNAAGNYAKRTWYGAPNIDTFDFHNFSGDDFDNSVYLREGRRYVVQLRWEDAWSGATTDLDVTLWDGLSIEARSDFFQLGRLEDDPFELFAYTPTSDGWYDLTVSHNGGSLPDWIQLQAWSVPNLEYYTLSGSIATPAESDNPGLLAVGATSASDINTIEPYSSQGPTPDGRTKPDIVGVAQGQSVSYRSSERPDGRWTGTSQASPHVAGMAALVKQNYPGYTPQQIANYLKTHAEERGAAGADNVWGHGFAKLLASDVSPQPTTSPTPTPIPTPEPPSDRDVLVALYNATDGDNWTDKENWLSDEPLGEWQGVTTDEEGSVIELHLWENNLIGEIPTELGDLSELTTLELQDNQLTGEIPSELGNLFSLSVLYLWENELNGEIPSELGNLPNLQRLSLSNNRLSGEIPSGLGDLSSLTHLYLNGNQLNGEIPAELGSLSSLTILDLGGNQLNGGIPSELGDLSSLSELYLSDNELSGEIPSELGSLANLQYLTLTRNQLSGEIPVELGSLSKMESMSLSRNRLSGEIPSELGGLSNLEQLYLYDNQLSGDIPSELLAISGLRIMALFGNQLTGDVSEHPEERAILTTLYNSTGGKGWKENENWGSAEPVFSWTRVLIDTSGHVTALWLDENELSGEIPSELGSLTNLARLYLYDNQLTGEIPSELGDLENLEDLYLAGNQLSGCIPTGLKDVPENDFADTGLPFCDEEPPDVSPDCTDYSESPDLAEKVESGELPSVCDRLPAEPLTIQTQDDTGGYGGILRRFYLGPADSCNFFRVSRASLVRFSQDGFSLIPSVAKDWEVSDDGKEWTFHLREGMKWSDGDDFTADDFVWQYENVILNEELTPGPPFFLRIGNDVGSIEKVDDNTVKFVFPQPNFLFAEIAAQADEACYGTSRNVPWAPSHYVQQFHIDHNPDVEQEAQDAGFDDWVEYYDYKTQYRLNPDKPTIAPWKFTNPLGDQVVISERNPYFWAVDPAGNQLPYLDGIQMTLVESTEAGTLMAAQGDIDMQGRHIRLDQYVPLREGRIDGGYTVLTWPTFGGSDVAFFFNMSLPGATGDAIRTKEFRQALSLAIDRESIKEVMFLGFGELRQNVPPPGHPHYPGDDIAKLRTEYDTEEANRLLDSVFPDKDDEGFRLSNGERIVMRVTVTEAFGPWPDAAHVVGRAWDAVGVKTDVDQTNRGENFDRWWTNEWAVMVWNDDTTSSTFSQIGTRAPAGNAFHGPGCALWIQTGGREGNPDAEGFPCLQESLDLLDMHRRGPGLPEAERNALGQEIYKTVVENQYSIGIVGLSPMVQGVVVKKNTLHNVPDAAANDWTFRTPNSAFPEQWYFGPEIEPVVALPAALSVGTSHACALDLNGVISCQGVNDSEQVTGLPPYGVFTAISVGDRHSCAIDVFGRMHCWGSDEHGQVSGRPTSGEFIAVGAGARHTCAVDATGSVHCWGSDDDGQSSPPAEGRFVAIGAGDSHTCGLLSDGTLECWGVFSSNSQ